MIMYSAAIDLMCSAQAIGLSYYHFIEDANLYEIIVILVLVVVGITKDIYMRNVSSSTFRFYEVSSVEFFEVC